MLSLEHIIIQIKLHGKRRTRDSFLSRLADIYLDSSAFNKEASIFSSVRFLLFSSCFFRSSGCYPLPHPFSILYSTTPSSFLPFSFFLMFFSIFLLSSISSPLIPSSPFEGAKCKIPHQQGSCQCIGKSESSFNSLSS